MGCQLTQVILYNGHKWCSSSSSIHDCRFRAIIYYIDVDPLASLSFVQDNASNSNYGENNVIIALQWFSMFS